jgi:acrylyl-CoA reductase (NADPH)
MTTTVLMLRRDDPDAPPSVAVETIADELLPAGEVTIDVVRSSINYKDALVLAGRPGLVREHPHVPGIDLAGTVHTSDDPRFAPGDEVLVTGCWLGERHWGGMATRARVPADWIVARPDGMDAQRAMALGTAGFTAQLAVDALAHGGVRPGDGPILVTGATGGVGTLAVMLLAHAGHEVEAATGSAGDPEVDALLQGLGAARTIPREDVSGAAGRALGSARWAGVVDVAGGTTLAGALAQTRPGGVVAACGLADDTSLTTTVMPFIVRGITLTGIDSVLHPVPERAAVWSRLHGAIDADALARITTTVDLAGTPRRAATLLEPGARGVRGRTVVNPNA